MRRTRGEHEENTRRTCKLHTERTWSDRDSNPGPSCCEATVLTSGGSSIGGARAPPLLKFVDEKKKEEKKPTSCQKTLYAKSFK